MSDIYKSAGVDIDKGDALVDWLQGLKSLGQNNRFGKTASGVGGFAAMFQVDFSTLKKPALVSCTDGVGTKVLLGIERDNVDGLGQDLVGMCVNDLYTLGATPLFFLDYYATGKLEEGQFKRVLKGIYDGLKLSDCALIGGETAEMPGLYEKGHFDLAGFVVGVVDTDIAWGPRHVRSGDVLVSLASSGFHSNGYSLIRKWLGQMGSKASPQLIAQLLQPTRIYSGMLDVSAKVPGAIRAAAHITGGGISGNLPRVLPEGAIADIEFKKIPTPLWMREFIETNGHSTKELENVFNLGVGMITVIDPIKLDPYMKAATAANFEPQVIGQVLIDQNGAQAKIDAIVRFS